MLKTRDRDKLINAAVYFAAHTAHCGKIKLIKLLYLLDFEHFRQTGRSVTGLDYHAWKLGPVPVALFQEWDALQPDFASAIRVVPEPVHDYVRERVVPRRAFDDSHFTRRELGLMADLAAKFRDEMSKPLVNFTHAELGPWAKTWDDGRGNHARIPYVLAVDDDAPDRDAILEAAAEHAGVRAANARSN